MKGNIWVESIPGTGSTFHFTAVLDVAEGILASDPAPARELGTASRGLEPLRILLAEDNSINQKLAQMAVQKMGHAIVVVGDGRSAVETAANEQFEVILMNLQTPEMDGFEATAEIRRSELGNNASHRLSR
jgi:PleD family two-component response regulator